MAAVEITEETKQQVERIGSADVVIGIAGAVSPDDLRPRAQQIIRELGSGVPSMRFVFAWPGVAPPPASNAGDGAENSPFAMLPFSPPAQSAGDLWSGVSANQRAVLSLAASLNARVCIVLGSDLAA